MSKQAPVNTNLADWLDDALRAGARLFPNDTVCIGLSYRGAADTLPYEATLLVRGTGREWVEAAVEWGPDNYEQAAERLARSLERMGRR